MWGFGFKYWPKKGLIVVVTVHMEPCCIWTWLIMHWALLLRALSAKLYFPVPQQKLPCLTGSFQWNSCPLFLSPYQGNRCLFKTLLYRELRSLLLLSFSSLCWEALLRKLICILVNVSRGRCLSGSLRSLQLHRNIWLLPWSLAFWRKSSLVLWLLPITFYFYISLPISFLV